VEQEKLKSAQKLGVIVAVALIVLAALEYVVAIAMDSGNLPYMLIMNVVDAALIIYYFMHVAHLWRGGHE
ncbi:uncharacterized protein METZ01_LOCUS231774, partial [marine metagenome]|jgi:cytochrome c oxidase subunit IV|tara:strand:+ start:241 stop:450 length:210 start_codon:yes stop_codon:yes gene_type:complete